MLCILRACRLIPGTAVATCPRKDLDVTTSGSLLAGELVPGTAIDTEPLKSLEVTTSRCELEYDRRDVPVGHVVTRECKQSAAHGTASLPIVADAQMFVAGVRENKKTCRQSVALARDGRTRASRHIFC